MNKLKYLSVAVNALKRLKNQNAVAAKGLYLIDINAMPHAIVYFLMNLAFEGFVFFLVQMKIQ